MKLPLYLDLTCTLWKWCLSCWSHASVGDTCSLVSGSFVQYRCAIWCSHCTGKVFLCGASRQPHSLRKCISHTGLRLWQDTPLSLTTITALLQPAGTPLKWSKRPRWHPELFFFLLLSLLRSFYHFTASRPSDTEPRPGLRGAAGPDAAWQGSLECLKWTSSFSYDLQRSDQSHLFEFSHLSTSAVWQWLFMCGLDSIF